MDKGHVSPCLLWVFCYEESNGRKNQLAENNWEYRNVKEEFRTHTYIHDTLFWLLTGLLTLYFIFIYNNGEIRFYIFLGIMLGITLYMLILSKLIIKISVKIVNFLKDILVNISSIIIYPFKIIAKIIKKIFLKPVSFIFINIRLFFTKKFIKFVKTLKKTQKEQKI